MKKLYTYLGILFMFLAFTTAQSQVLIIEDFDEDLPSDWSGVPGFFHTELLPCDEGSVRRNFVEDNGEQGTLTSPVGVASGEDIIVSFDYKIIDVASGNDATTGDFGEMNLQYSTDGGSTWITYQTIDSTNHVPDDECQTWSDTIPAVEIPSGSDFVWRLNGTWNEGDYYFYVDNFSAIEQVDCIAPVDIVVAEDEDSGELIIDFDSAEISWTEVGDATEWNLLFGQSGFPSPNLLPSPPGTTTVNTTDTTEALTNLNEGTSYDVYVQTVCGSDGNSIWVGPLTFQTTAIGSDCEAPIEVSSFPYVTTDDTAVYGNDYSGSPGVNCASVGNFLDGDDVVYHFVPNENDILQIELSGLGDKTGTGIFIYESCDDIGQECVDGSANESTGSHGINDLYVTAGQDYYIVISSFPSPGESNSFNYTLNITGFDCDNFEAPVGDSVQDFIAGQTLGDLYSVDETIAGATLIWYSDAAATNEIPLTTALVDNASYYVSQSVLGCESDLLEVTVEEFDCENELGILSTTTGDAACESGTVELSATANSDNIYWYDSEIGGETLYKGGDFETAEITETTSYWVSEAFLGETTRTGQANPGPNVLSTSTSNNYGVLFETSALFTLVDVQVFVTGSSGNITVELRDESGLAVQQKTFNVPGGSAAMPTPVTLPLNFTIPPGEYRLLKTEGPSMIYVTSSNASFPYSIGNSGNVTSGSSSSGTSSNYYYFFNWTIVENEILCESERTEVVAAVNDIIPIEVESSETTVCVGESVDLTASSMNEDYIYTWNPGNLQGATVTVTPVEGTTYTVTATDPVSGCPSTENAVNEEVTINVIGLPDVLTMNPDPAVVCVGESIELVAGGIVEDFEESMDEDSWSYFNSSSGSEAAWGLEDTPHLGAQISSNNNSQFYISNADVLGAGGTVDTELISPSFNLVGVESAFVSFYHYYRHHPTTQADVDVSTDGGSTWTTAETYTATIGSASDFAYSIVDLDDFTSYADVKIRFHYEGGWGWWWAIDNVTIIREYEGDLTWYPQTDLYLNPEGTVAYNGSDAARVYYKGDIEGQYDYTATLVLADCGSVSGDIEVTVNDITSPVAEDEQILLEGSTLADVEVQGQNLIWYEDDISTVVLPESTPLVDGETYYVSQVFGCESERIAVTVYIYVEEAECLAPVDLVVDDIEGTSVIISWNDPELSGEDDILDPLNFYYVVTQDSNDEIVREGSILLGTNSMIIDNLEPETEYTYQIYSVCDEEDDLYSETISIPFTTEEMMEIGADNFKKLTYYPNPTSGMVTFESSNTISKIEVFNLLGQKVFEKDGSSTTLSLDYSNFASGAYLTKISSGESFKIVRILKE